jgi:penicillin-binding protein 2
MAADKRAARLGVLAVVATLLFGALGVRLWFLQTVQAAQLQETVDSTKQVTVNIPPERGRIFDADGRVLADNKGILTVSVDWAAMRSDTDRASLFNRLSGWLQMPVADMEARYDSGRYSRYAPMPLEENVPENVAIALQERVEDFPGMTIDVDWQRVYPYAPLASHVIGYMGAITAEDADHYEQLGYDTSSQGEDVGRSGVEQSMEERLHGRWGQRTYEIDSRNHIVRTISYTPPVSGEDVQLSIDLDLQYYAERLLITQLKERRTHVATNPEVTKPDGQKGPMDPSLAVGTPVHYRAPAGSVIVMDQNTGQVMAMASYPTFDNRWFSAGIDGAKFNELFPQDVPPDEARLTNRAIQGQYNMGSTFKVFTAYAALASGKMSPDSTYNDQGVYQMQSIAPERCAEGVRCEFRNATCANGFPCRYGPVNVAESLAVSSDAFYYRLGEEFYLTPGTPFQDLVRTLGLGSDTGIDLPAEFDGRVPTDELKAALLERGVLDPSETPNLQPGDLLQMAIGQGLMAATPLQLAVGYSAIANGGHVPTPRVVKAIWAPETPDSATPGLADLALGTVVEQVAPHTRDIPMPPGVRDPIVSGVRRNVTGPGVVGPDGYRSTTAEELFRVGYPPEAIQIAGKTGTAQGRNSYPWNDSSVFSAFSVEPERPFSVVAYLERAGYGSQGAAPVVKCMYLALSGLTVLDPPPIADPLDLTDDVAAHDLPVVDRSCMASTDTVSGPTID